LFDSYFTKGKDGGTGLGLAIAKKFVTDHRGTIRCQSSVEHGTEFLFTVPSSPEASVVESAREALSSQNLEMKTSQGLSILVADGDAAYRAALMTLLSGLMDAGFVERLSLHEASSSSEALRLAEQLPLDLIVVASSLGSASASGVEVIDDLRERGNAAMICLHSDGNAMPGRADFCIAKPLDAGKAMRLLASASARTARV
jgi:CheY-like chemotaxis protein